MPTNPGVPISQLTAGVQNQFDWLSVNQNEMLGAQQSSLMRGQPPALAWWQQRQIRGPGTVAQPAPIYITSPPYSRGAPAHAPKFGVLNINPIGAGQYAPYRLPTIAGPGARYMFSAIWFDVQTIPTSIRMNPSVPIETINALIASSYVGGMYPVV
jgi:hypothetical protein